MKPTPLVTVFRHSENAETVPAGRSVFQEGDAGDCMFVVQDGEVDILLHAKVVETVGPGGLVGEMALIDAEPRSATAVTRTECKLVRVDQQRFKFLVQQHPFFALEVMRVMAHRLRHMDAILSREA